MSAASLGAEVVMEVKKKKKSGKHKVHIEMNQQIHRKSVTGHQGLFRIKPVLGKEPCLLMKSPKM